MSPAAHERSTTFRHEELVSSSRRDDLLPVVLAQLVEVDGQARQVLPGGDAGIHRSQRRRPCPCFLGERTQCDDHHYVAPGSQENDRASVQLCHTRLRELALIYRRTGHALHSPRLSDMGLPALVE
jgi:hypothetical protein